MSEEEFNKFKEGVYKSAFFVKDKSRLYLYGFYTVLEKDGFLGVDKKLKELKKAIHKSKKQSIVRFKKEITTVLEKEIIRRVFYRKGMYEYYLLKNKEVIVARELLNDKGRYFDIIN